MKLTRAILGAGLGVGASAAVWALSESLWAHRIREFGVPVLPAGSPGEVRVLHLSDIHLLPCQRPRRRFLRSLARKTEPHAVLVTGDLIASSPAVSALLADLDELLDLPGAFVFGSNDYFAPKFRNPLRYFWLKAGVPAHSPQTAELPHEALAAALEGRGWRNLSNRRGSFSAGGVSFSAVGVDDPHLGYDEMPPNDGVRGEVHLGVAHAPYTRTFDDFLADGCDLAVAGHTHGGQICVPGVGALVTNCDLPAWRASGLQGWPTLRPDGICIEPRRLWTRAPMAGGERSPMWVNISAGLGTSPFTPVRLACPPEVTLLRLTHRMDFQP